MITVVELSPVVSITAATDEYGNHDDIELVVRHDGVKRKIDILEVLELIDCAPGSPRDRKLFERGCESMSQLLDTQHARDLEEVRTEKRLAGLGI